MLMAVLYYAVCIHLGFLIRGLHIYFFYLSISFIYLFICLLFFCMFSMLWMRKMDAVGQGVSDAVDTPSGRRCLYYSLEYCSLASYTGLDEIANEKKYVLILGAFTRAKFLLDELQYYSWGKLPATPDHGEKSSQLLESPAAIRRKEGRLERRTKR